MFFKHQQLFVVYTCKCLHYNYHIIIILMLYAFIIDFYEIEQI